MNIGKTTSWQIAAITAAALLAGVAQAHDQGHRQGHRQHDRIDNRYDNRYERRYDNRHDDRYDRRVGGRRQGRYDDLRRYDGAGQHQRLRNELEFWAPPLSPPWLYRHGLLGRGH